MSASCSREHKLSCGGQFVRFGVGVVFSPSCMAADKTPVSPRRRQGRSWSSEPGPPSAREREESTGARRLVGGEPERLELVVPARRVAAPPGSSS